MKSPLRSPFALVGCMACLSVPARAAVVTIDHYESLNQRSTNLRGQSFVPDDALPASTGPIFITSARFQKVGGVENVFSDNGTGADGTEVYLNLYSGFSSGTGTLQGVGFLGSSDAVDFITPSGTFANIDFVFSSPVELDRNATVYGLFSSTSTAGDLVGLSLSFAGTPYGGGRALRDLNQVNTRDLRFLLTFDAVPEPSGVLLLGMGAFAGMLRRRR